MLTSRLRQLLYISGPYENEISNKIQPTVFERLANAEPLFLSLFQEFSQEFSRLFGRCQLFRVSDLKFLGTDLLQSSLWVHVIKRKTSVETSKSNNSDGPYVAFLRVGHVEHFWGDVKLGTGRLSHLFSWLVIASRAS